MKLELTGYHVMQTIFAFRIGYQLSHFPRSLPTGKRLLLVLVRVGLRFYHAVIIRLQLHMVLTCIRDVYNQKYIFQI